MANISSVPTQLPIKVSTSSKSLSDGLANDHAQGILCKLLCFVVELRVGE